MAAHCRSESEARGLSRRGTAVVRLVDGWPFILQVCRRAPSAHGSVLSSLGLALRARAAVVSECGAPTMMSASSTRCTSCARASPLLTIERARRLGGLARVMLRGRGAAQHVRSARHCDDGRPVVVSCVVRAARAPVCCRPGPSSCCWFFFLSAEPAGRSLPGAALWDHQPKLGGVENWPKILHWG